jgi:hypothetical protein
VITGPKISSTIVTDLGSLVKMTVGWMKNPFESSAKNIELLEQFHRGCEEIIRLTLSANENFPSGVLSLRDIPINLVKCNFVAIPNASI